jgi:hypothetical protein
MIRSSASALINARAISRVLRHHWIAVLFVCFLVVPLYLLLISIVVRSGLLDLRGAAFGDEQFKALIAFLGVALGTAGTVLGALIAKATSDRAFAEQRESERRSLVMEAESNNRQRLDTAVQVLNLIKVDAGSYPGKAVTGGALATLVHLGQPVIAMRTLQSALADDAVDIATAVWLIDQVLSANPRERAHGEVSASKDDALEVLAKLVDSLPDDDHPGNFEWPSCAYGQWPRDLSLNCGLLLLIALLGLLTSRPLRWWVSRGQTWTWVIYTLDQAAREPTSDPRLREEAATYAVCLLNLLAPQDGVNAPSEVLSASEISQRMEQIAHPDWRSHQETSDRVDAWVEDARRYIALE